MEKYIIVWPRKKMIKFTRCQYQKCRRDDHQCLRDMRREAWNYHKECKPEQFLDEVGHFPLRNKLTKLNKVKIDNLNINPITWRNEIFSKKITSSNSFTGRFYYHFWRLIPILYKHKNRAGRIISEFILWDQH